MGWRRCAARALCALRVSGDGRVEVPTGVSRCWLLSLSSGVQAEEGKTSAESQAIFNAALSTLLVEAKALVQVPSAFLAGRAVQSLPGGQGFEIACPSFLTATVVAPLVACHCAGWSVVGRYYAAAGTREEDANGTW